MGKAAAARQSALAYDQFSKKGNPVQAAPGQTPAGGAKGFSYQSYGSADDYNRGRATYYGQQGYTPPNYAYRTYPSFGMWDGLFLFFMLSNLNSHSTTFYHRQNDPGFKAWRAEADKMSQDNEDLKKQLTELDTRMKSMEGTPINPDYVPPDLPAQVALAQDQVVKPPKAGFPWGWTIGGVAVLGAAGWWLMRRRQSLGAA